MKKIAVGASSFGSGGSGAADLLKGAGYEIVPNPFGRKMTENEIIAHLKGAEGLLAGLEPLNGHVFASSPGLKAVARVGVGMDNVDTDAAKQYGIRVSNTPDGPSQAVAEMTLAALLTIARQIVPSNSDMHSGVWKKRMGFSVCGITVLLIGYGRIARRFEEMLKSFEARVLAWDPLYPGLAPDTLEGMLGQSDVISLHASGNSVVITGELIKHMKPGAVLLNSARGGLVDEAALYPALKSGHVSWYWADCFSDEPYGGRLADCENALLTPHISTYTGLCRQRIEMQAAQNLLEDLRHV